MVPVIHAPFSSTLGAVCAPECEQCSQCTDEESIRHQAVNTGDEKQTFACEEVLNHLCVNCVNTAESVNSLSFKALQQKMLQLEVVAMNYLA